MAEIQAPKPQWRVDIIVSVSAMLVSLATFGIYLYQTKIIHEQARASVYPHLLVTRSSTIGKDGEFSFYVRNVGTGPAFLKSMQIKYKGKIYKEFNNKGEIYRITPLTFLMSILPTEDFPNLGSGAGIPVVIPAGETERFLNSNDPKKDSKLLTEIFDEAEINVCYSSVYKDYWTVEKWKQPIECKNCENEDLFKPIKK